MLDFTDIDSPNAVTRLARTLRSYDKLGMPPLPENDETLRPSPPISQIATLIDRVNDYSIRLSREEQERLLADIRSFLDDPETLRDARYALERFKKRADHDLLAVVGAKIDRLLEQHPDKKPRPPIPTFLIWAGVAIALLLVLSGVGLLLNRLANQVSSTSLTLTPLPTRVAQIDTSTPSIVPSTNTPTISFTTTAVPPSITPSATFTSTPVPPSATSSVTFTETLVPPSVTFTAIPASATPSATLTHTLIPPTFTLTPPPTATAYSKVTANNQWTPKFQDFNGVAMAEVPPGCFNMGSANGQTDEKPVTKICFDKPFWIDKTEVTQAQFTQFGGSAQPVGGSAFTGDNRPVENITWFEARDFCAKRAARLPIANFE